MAYIMDWIKYGKNRSWPNCSYFLDICLKRLKTTKYLSVPVEIRNVYIPNTS